MNTNMEPSKNALFSTFGSAHPLPSGSRPGHAQPISSGTDCTPKLSPTTSDNVLEQNQTAIGSPTDQRALFQASTADVGVRTDARTSPQSTFKLGLFDSVCDDEHGPGYRLARSQRRYQCNFQGCVDPNQRPSTFTRKTDLKRHLASVHANPSINCKYKNCDRKDENGFRRQDHYVEHLRGYHMEAVEKGRKRQRVQR